MCSKTSLILFSFNTYSSIGLSWAMYCFLSKTGDKHQREAQRYSQHNGKSCGWGWPVPPVPALHPSLSGQDASHLYQPSLHSEHQWERAGSPLPWLFIQAKIRTTVRNKKKNEELLQWNVILRQFFKFAKRSFWSFFYDNSDMQEFKRYKCMSVCRTPSYIFLLVQFMLRMGTEAWWPHWYTPFCQVRLMPEMLQTGIVY